MAIKHKIKIKGKILTDLETAKEEADQDYKGGGAYRAFLKLFFKAKKEKDDNDTGSNNKD
jgi:hypothetical protein